MTTTPASGVVTNVLLASIAEDVSEQLLQPRRVYLRHRAPASRYVHQLRRDIASGKAKPIAMALSITFADQDDGLPTSLLIQPYLTIIAMIEARGQASSANALAESDRAIAAASVREQRAQTELDVAQLQLRGADDPIAACDRALDASAQYDVEQNRLVTKIRERRALLAVHGATLPSAKHPVAMVRGSRTS
jgi:hypothetical protein